MQICYDITHRSFGICTCTFSLSRCPPAKATSFFNQKKQRRLDILYAAERVPLKAILRVFFPFLTSLLSFSFCRRQADFGVL